MKEAVSISNDIRRVLRDWRDTMLQISKLNVSNEHMQDAICDQVHGVVDYFDLDAPDQPEMREEDVYQIWSRIFDCASHNVPIDIMDIRVLNGKMLDMRDREDGLRDVQEGGGEAEADFGPRRLSGVPRRVVEG